MSTKRVLYRRDTLYVGNWRENALGWLNGDLPKRYYSSPARRRIERLIDALQTLIQLRRSFKTIERGPSNGGFTRLTIQMPADAANAIKLVEKLMRRYPSWPVLGWDAAGNLSFGRLSTQLNRAQEEEAEAALAVMSLAEVNELPWLRRCLCTKWFFARRKTQRSCSAKCRHKLYEQTEGFRVRRRKYMRRYYRLKRSGKVK
jgi:hypothetical protein